MYLKNNKNKILFKILICLNYRWEFHCRYLKRVHESCDLISSETIKEEMIYTNKKEMIKEELDQLENKKQLYWVVSSREFHQ